MRYYGLKLQTKPFIFLQDSFSGQQKQNTQNDNTPLASFFPLIMTVYCTSVKNITLEHIIVNPFSNESIVYTIRFAPILVTVGVRTYIVVTGSRTGAPQRMQGKLSVAVVPPHHLLFHGRGRAEGGGSHPSGTIPFLRQIRCGRIMA